MTNKLWTLLLTGLGISGLLPRCNCEEGGIQKAAVEMRLTFVEIDSCSMLPISRRIPDDFQGGLAPTTDFGSVGERTFEIRSIGSAPLKVSGVTLSAEDPEFTLTILDASEQPVTFPLQLSPNGSESSAPAGAVIKVAYRSLDAEPDLVDLVIATDDPNREEVRFALSAGRGSIQVCAEGVCSTDGQPAVAFGDVSLGEEGTKQVVIKNVGMGDLDLRSVKLESSSLEFCAPEATTVPTGVEDCAPIQQCMVLKPNETYTVNVRYRPGDGGLDDGTLTIVSGDAASGNVVVPINARGAGPALCVCVLENGTCNAVNSVDFGLADVGVGVTKTVRLESCGTEAVEVSEALLETAAGPFQTDPEFVLSSAFSLGVLAPGAYSEGTITYTPTGAGINRGGLRYGIVGSPTPYWLPLVGQAATCDMEVVPLMVSFGTVAGGSQVDRGVLLVNNGAKICSVTGITDPTNSFTIINKPATPLPIAPGSSEALTVRFAPPAGPVLQYSSSFVVTSDEIGPGASSTVQLTAEGGGTPTCAVRITPMGNDSPLTMRDGRLQFGAVNIGYDKVLGIRIDNVGNTDCTLQSYRLTTEVPSQFTAMATTAVPGTIPPGSTASIDVTFSPTGPATNLLGLYGGRLNFVAFTLAGPGLAQTDWEISLNAQPTVPTIDVLPDSLDFGVVTWDPPVGSDRSACGSAERTINIYNSGTGALTINSLTIDATSDHYFEITNVTQGGSNVAPPYTAMIPPGGAMAVGLRFFPSRANPGGHQGLLVIDNTVTNPGGTGSPLTVPLSGSGTTNAGQTDIFQQLVDNKVDVLWVVDDSGSMSEEQNLLAQNFASFIGFADSLGVDYQVAVTTTEINDAVSGKIWSCSGYPKIILPATPNKVAAFQCAANVTSPPGGNSRPNPGGSDEAEAGLQAARLALDVPVINAENAGFLRADARLAVIIVSDEEDQSPGSVNLYIDFFRNVKGFANPQLVSVSAIAGDVPNGCATAEAGTRYLSAVQALNGQFESVCSASWTALLNNIGLGVFALRTSWTLSRPADPATIVVRVNGTVVAQGGASGWTFDAASNTLTFSGAPPAAGATVEVQYGSLCLP